MKKALLLLIVLTLLFISVSPVSAKKDIPSNCSFYREPVGILEIKPDSREIKVPYVVCMDFSGTYYYSDIWLSILDTTKIKFVGDGSNFNGTFDDLSTEGQLIKYTYDPIDVCYGIANTISIYIE